MPMMTFHQKIFAVLASGILVAFILTLVYKRRIKERYSWLWLLTGVAIFILVVWYDFLLFLTRFIGAVSPQTTLLLFGMFFMILINIHFSIRISRFYDQIKDVVQALAVIEKRLRDLEKAVKPPSGDTPKEGRRQS